MTVVEETGDMVGDGLLLELLVKASVLDDDGGLLGDGGERVDLLLGEAYRLAEGVDSHQADGPVLDPQRVVDKRLDLEGLEPPLRYERR